MSEGKHGGCGWDPAVSRHPKNQQYSVRVQKTGSAEMPRPQKDGARTAGQRSAENRRAGLGAHDLGMPPAPASIFVSSNDFGCLLLCRAQWGADTIHLKQNSACLQETSVSEVSVQSLSNAALKCVHTQVATHTMEALTVRF